MPLVIQFNGPYAAPKILCDHCGEAIREAKDGNYQWTHAAGCEEGQTAHVYFTHKRCCHAFERTHGDPAAWARSTSSARPAPASLSNSTRPTRARPCWRSPRATLARSDAPS